MSAIACGDDDIEDNPSSSGGTGDGGTTSSGASGTTSSGASGTSSGDGGSNEFVQFVRDQIVNETRNNTPAVTLNDKTFTDSERSDLFDPAFFAGDYEQ